MSNMNRINIRVTPSEYGRIASRAKQAGVSISEYLRRTALHERDGPTIIVDDDVLKDMLRNLKGAATNVNQVAYVVNSRHRPEELLPELRRSLACIEASSEAITKLITDARNSI